MASENQDLPPMLETKASLIIDANKNPSQFKNTMLETLRKDKFVLKKYKKQSIQTESLFTNKQEKKMLSTLHKAPVNLDDEEYLSSLLKKADTINDLKRQVLTIDSTVNMLESQVATPP
jgi:hypothetical protein